MTTSWVGVPSPPLVSRAEPYVIPASQTGALEVYFRAQGVKVQLADVSTARSESDVILSLKSILPFPDWCGSGWDSMEDAFEELRQAWAFPLVVLMTGLPTLMTAEPHLALQTVVRLADFTRAFSVSGDQLLVVYQW